MKYSDHYKWIKEIQFSVVADNIRAPGTAKLVQLYFKYRRNLDNDESTW